MMEWCFFFFQAPVERADFARDETRELAVAVHGAELAAHAAAADEPLPLPVQEGHHAPHVRG